MLKRLAANKFFSRFPNSHKTTPSPTNNTSRFVLLFISDAKQEMEVEQYNLEPFF